jgi:tripartite-type tricarboxylate transporter receptor subunit TctC
VVRAAPDGLQVSIGHIGPHVINGAMYQLDYELLRDLAPVGMFVTNPQIVVSKNGCPRRTSSR